MKHIVLEALRKFGKSSISLLYPPLCLHCREGLEDSSHLLCGTCLSLLELIDPKERCPRCFSPDFFPEKLLCSECIRSKPICDAIAAAFDYVGPAATLIQKLKYGDQSYLAKGCGGYLAAQFLRLGWPIPDVIVPVPISLAHWMERGFNQSLLLAQTLSGILNVPVQEALKRKSGDYSQAGLSRSQRVKLDGATVHLKKAQQLQDKCVLLIDDVMTTGSTMRKCAEAMLEECPAHIYGLAVCRAIK